MKYTDFLEIALPRQQVVLLLSDPELLPMWLRGLVRHEPVDGVHGRVGTISRVVLRMGEQEMEASETITRREPADVRGLSVDDFVQFDREIVAEGMWSITRDRLTEIGPARTLWASENEYRFDHLPMRMVSPFMRGAFRTQSRQHMQDFRAFAEQGTDVRTADR